MPPQIRETLTDYWISTLQGFGKHVWNYGTPVFELDWDLLIILDACRLDVMEEVAPGVEFLPDPPLDSVNSVGSMTREWLDKNFGDEYADEVANTAFVCGNPHSYYALDEADWLALDEPWRQGYGDEAGTVPPERVTEAAIDLASDTDPDRMIVHYMQPHAPFRSRPDLSPPELRSHDGGERDFQTVDDKIRNGTLDVETVWDAYRDNLEWALEHVEVLLDNVDAEKAVVSSDHGHTLGEYGCYAHPKYVPLPPLKKVPWVPVEANGSEESAVGTRRSRRDDEEESTPDERESTPDEEVRERLRDLGYTDDEITPEADE